MALDGHECNAYCRPAEGEHCELHHSWSNRPIRSDKLVRDFHRQAVGKADDMRTGGVIVKVEAAGETPKMSRDEAITYLRSCAWSDAMAIETVDTCHQHAILIWSKVPVEVPA